MHQLDKAHFDNTNGATKISSSHDMPRTVNSKTDFSVAIRTVRS